MCPMSAKEISCHIVDMPIKMEGGGHFWKSLAHEMKLCMKILCFEISIKSCQSKRAQSHKSNTDLFFLLQSTTVWLSIETSFKIRQFGSREQNKKKRWGDDAGWLREWLGRAVFTTAKLNRNQHMLLYRLCFFCVSFLLSHIHTWPQMLALCV